MSLARDIIVLVILAGFCILITATPASYDQRQTGDFNVQINLKDLQVVALIDKEHLEDYMEYDYFYDYADFTIKPIVKPSTAPTSSIEPWITWPTHPPSSSTEKSNETSISTESPLNTTEISTTIEISNDVSTTEISVLSSTKVTTNVQNATTAQSSMDSSTQSSPIEITTYKLDVRIDPANPESRFSVKESSHPEKPIDQSEKRCRSGYSPDGKGRCRRMNRHRLSLIPLAMRFAPKLLGFGSHNTKTNR